MGKMEVMHWVQYTASFVELNWTNRSLILIKMDVWCSPSVRPVRTNIESTILQSSAAPVQKSKDTNTTNIIGSASKQMVWESEKVEFVVIVLSEYDSDKRQRCSCRDLNPGRRIESPSWWTELHYTSVVNSHPALTYETNHRDVFALNNWKWKIENYTFTFDSIFTFSFLSISFLHMLQHDVVPWTHTKPSTERAPGL